MSKYKFTAAQRHAVYTVHGEKCYMCGRALDMVTMEVDHILPEHLEKNPTKRSETLIAFGLDPTFDLNSFANWKPACRPCNGKKLAMVFEPHPIYRIHITEAISKAAEAARIAEKLVADQELAEALTVLEKADEQGRLSAAERTRLQPLVAFQIAERPPEQAREPVRLTPLDEVLSDDGSIQMVRGPFGVGGRASKPIPGNRGDFCPGCGDRAYFNGTRCMRCGEQSDGD